MPTAPELTTPMASPSPPEREQSRVWRFIRDHRNVIIPHIAIIALILWFQLQNPVFVSVGSAENILRQMAFLTVLALAGTFPILIGGIDLSVASNATLAGILIATWIDRIGPALAMLAVVAVGALVGLLNGAVVLGLRVPSFLVTLGMMSVLDGASNTISGGGPVSYTSDFLQWLVNETLIPSLPNGALLALVLVGLASALAFLTAFGRQLYAVGGNERAARLSGVRVPAVKLAAFSLAGGLAAIAGIIFTGQASTGVPMGPSSSLLNGIAAIVVGGTALSGGVGGPHRSLLGALVIVILGAGMDITSVDPYTQLVVKGIVVVAAVALTIDRKRYGVIK